MLRLMTTVCCGWVFAASNSPKRRLVAPTKYSLTAQIYTISRRESSQWPLERKRRQADWAIDNSASIDKAARQLEDVLTRMHDGEKKTM